MTFRYKEIALRNYLVNLAAAATTAYEYEIRSDAAKKDLRLQSSDGVKRKLNRDDQKKLWDGLRLAVFKRAGLEGNPLFTCMRYASMICNITEF